MENDITFLGKIIRVDSNIVEVEVSNEIPSAAPIINGRLYKIGQIGTFVKIPMGNIVSFGIVSSVSNRPANLDIEKIYTGSRFLSIQLVGEKIGDGNFEKGIGTYPTINDEVHLVIEKDLYEIYGQKDEGSINIGKHASSDNLTVYVNLHNLVLRHSAILGSTGSGKSNATVTVLRRILEDFSGSRIILIDPHGEYASAFPDARKYKIGDKSMPLLVPFWLMNFEELAFFLVGAKQNDDQRPEYRKLRELIYEKKKAKADILKSGKVNSDYITVDSPIPFNIRELWYEIYWWMNATFNDSAQDKQTSETACEEKKGNPNELIPPEFKAHGAGAAPPFKSKHYQEFYLYEKKLFTRLKDSRYDFMFDPGDYKDTSSSKDLHDLLNEWIGNEEKMTILDLSGIPFEILDITVGIITRFIYDSMFWGRNEKHTGKNRPILLVFEEAHAYLNKNADTSYSRQAVERIFKEGRKFGVGSLVISQRPSEISETILAQIGTFIALRLTNSGDQSIIKSSAPDNLNSLIDLLPSLRVGEAVIIGEAIKIPSRVRMKLNNPRPTSADPELVENWKKEYINDTETYKSVVKKLREKKM
ncbi:MAG: ATP-binding protein [Treponema sp.]|nr:ATP-binding protein [Treponema sp.]